MSFDTHEASPHSGSKVFLYLMESGPQYWAHTTNGEPITVGGKTYTPLAISHTEVDPANGEFTLDLPFDHPVSLLHVPYLPPRPVLVQITAYHRQESTDIRRVQVGALLSFQQKGVFAEFRCADPHNPMAKLIPHATHGPNCRHVTYGKACGLDRDDFKVVVDDIADITGLTITSPKIALAGTGYLRYGYAENPLTGELRYVNEHIGGVVTLAYPFIGIDESTVLNFYAGDDFKPETCRIKFNNKPNYLGFDFHPKYNIFLDGFRPGGYTNTVGTGPGSGRINPTGL